MAEQWRAIPGWPYEASSLGRVRSAPRPPFNDGWLLTPTADKDGYLRVTLSAGGRRKTFGVHALVLLAFVGPCPRGRERRHLDGDRTNNRLWNLKYGTKVQNERDKKWTRRRGQQLEIGTDVLIGTGASRPVTVGTIGTGAVTLSEAVTLGILTCTLYAARKAQQRDPSFPEPAGKWRGRAQVFEVAALRAYDAIRPRR